MKKQEYKLSGVDAYNAPIVETISIIKYNPFERLIRWVQRKINPIKTVHKIAIVKPSNKSGVEE